VRKIVVPEEPTPRRVNHWLILAIARAKTWMQGFLDGRYQDTAEIVQRFKLNDRACLPVAAVWLSGP